jgi:hypothetical protein
VAGHAGRAWRQAERLFDEAVQAQEAVEQITEALGWFDTSGSLYTRELAQKQLDEAIPQLQGECWNKAKRMLSDARTLSHLDRLHEQLRSAIAEPMWRDALVHLWYLLRRLKQAEGDERVHGLCRRKREIFYGRAARALSWAKGFSLTDAHNELIRE